MKTMDTLLKINEEDTKIKQFTHTDLDGIAPEMMLRTALPNTDFSVEYCSYNSLYKRLMNFLNSEEVNEVNKIIITDLSINDTEKDLIEALNQHSDKVILIDHHKSTFHLNQYDWAFVSDIHESGKIASTSSLMLNYLGKSMLLPTGQTLENMKSFAEEVRLYDTWDWKTNTTSLLYFLNEMFYLLGGNDFKQKYLARDLDTTPTTEDKAILFALEKKYKQYLDKKPSHLKYAKVPYKDSEIEVAMVVSDTYISELGNDLLHHKKVHADMIIILNFNTKNASFRSKDSSIDCTYFAKQLGGGGHPKASGSPLNEDLIDLYLDLYLPIK